MMPGYDIQTPLDLLNAGNAGEAIPQLEFLTTRMPSYVAAHVLLAQAYASQERWQESLSTWQNALFLMPNSPAIRNGLRQVMRILSRQRAQRTAAAQATSPAESVSAEAAPKKDPTPSSADEPVTLQTASPPASVESKATESDGSHIDALSSTEKQVAEEAPDGIDTPAMGTGKVVQNASHPKPVSHGAIVPPVLASFVQSEAGIGEDEELDHLIQELESARIVPKPDQKTADIKVEDEDIGDVASETLARIYEGQKKFDEAALVYEKLAILQPEKAECFAEKAAELRVRSTNEGD